MTGRQRRVPAGNIELVAGFGPDEPLPGRRFALPGDPVESPRRRDIAIEHLALSVHIGTSEHEVRAVADLRVRCLATVDEITLDACGLAVESVAVDGGPVEFRVEPDQLALTCPRPLAADTRAAVTIAYRAGPSPGLQWTAGPDPIVYTQGQPAYSRRWFPCVDDLTQRLTTDISVTVPRGHTAVAGGTLVDRHDEGATTTFRWRQDVPHVPYLVSLVAGRLVEVDLGRVDEVPLVVYGRVGTEADLRRVFAPTADIFRFLRERIGLPYPYGRYAQVVVPEHVAGGMENASVAHLSERVVYDERASADVHIEFAVLHELCHQWFGNLWTCADWSHLWLQEGFCRLFEVLWLQHTRGFDEAEAYRLERAQWYFDEDRRYRRPLVPATFRSPTDLFDRHSYEKACLVVNLLRHWLGEGFWPGLRAFARANAGGSVTLASLVDAFDRATGQAIEPVIGPLVRRPGFPELEWAAEWVAGTLWLIVEQVQAAASFVVPLDFALSGADGFRRIRVLVDSRRHRFSLDCPGRPDLVIADPDRAVVGTVRRQPAADPAEAARLATHHPHAAGRIDALQALGDAAPSVVVDALGDPFWGVRAAAARCLPESDETTALLRAALDTEPDARGRAALVEILGRADHTVAVAALTDRSVLVEATATRVLARADDPDSVARTRTQLGRPSYGEMIRCAALQGLAEGDQPGRGQVVLDWTGADRPGEARETAVAMLPYAGLDEDVARRRLAELLTDASAAVQVTAVVGLTRIGGPPASAILADWLPSVVDDRARRAGREALAMLDDPA